tara:strand:+ start:166 stop:774 length:609 start_codon:yes stop_codon:yes gene_type:complete
MANVNSKYFDSIRISKKKEASNKENTCQWEDCEMPAVHKAPKGRGMEGQYYNFCLKHVREYNKNYNYFEGMNHTDLSKFQKEAMLGDRPTWKLGVDNRDQLGNFSAEEILKKLKANRAGTHQDGEKTNLKDQKRQKIGNAAKKALYVLGLDNASSSDEIKNRYKLLVKKHHPDLKGGSETTDEKLIEIIKSYRYLKSIGLVS